MSKFNRNNMPGFLKYWVNVTEKAVIPLIIFQFIRTILFPSILDILLLGGLIALYFSFQSKSI
ncbi:hypothetical protein [Terribacillus saccharophilus]|uniref:Uncharacterized protein n=1 Tax=Terribacillus saccharophilus TaxID=361277 RepID=A0A268ACA7_9BACI|nr:hypothetical protein [Terribacillus saccharophilus]PAD21761.1 hypothetical protein CHH64_07095 [Terribacillus saccharophilus]PAF19820.1 hypothetical protein CHH51_00955 [Terribacillus saccharophilus]PAF21793.1 hypothetical protein CHH49_09520 [Terribacillus saccharophilus]PAF34246.1 hypothetical protein CHH69_16765 [Terribacillus saccharophilus]PAF37950.1 hypothetical protein CHH58_06275 [Terribacillus saccharophilus]